MLNPVPTELMGAFFKELSPVYEQAKFLVGFTYYKKLLIMQDVARDFMDENHVYGSDLAAVRQFVRFADSARAQLTANEAKRHLTFNDFNDRCI